MILTGGLILVTTAVFCAFFFIKNHDMIRLANKFKGPRAFPIIGNYHWLVGKKSEDIFQMIQDLCNRFGTPTRVWVGPLLLIYLNRPHDIQRVLNSQFCLDKMYIYKIFGWEKGVLSTRADIWQIHRKSLNPCFTPTILESFIPTFVEKSKMMVNKLKHFSNTRDPFDIFKFLSCCTLDTICATTLGFDISSQCKTNEVEFVTALEELFPIINKRIFNIFLHPVMIYRHTDLYRRENELRRKIAETTNKIITAKRVELDSNKKNDENNLLCALLRLNRSRYTDDAIREELEGIIVVGNETTALATAFVILMLAMHPGVQDKAMHEIERIFTEEWSDNEEVDYTKNLCELRYLEMIIKETLRLFPPGPLIVKKATENVQLENGVIPKGANVVLNVFNLHRDPSIWGRNAELFCPERFTPIEIKYRHPYSFVPFSGGRRMCLGYKYAMNSMKIMIVELLRAFKFSTPLTMNDLELEMNITLKLKNRHVVQVACR